MIHENEMKAIEARAHALRKTMPQVCRLAGKFPQSWYRARARGKANYTLIDPIETALATLEKERSE